MSKLKLSKLILRDGRTLAWREYGITNGGFPIVFMHGNLNSALYQPAWSKTTEQATAAGARVFALDRPGYGETSSHSNRTYLDWAKDVQELVNSLSLGPFAIIGYSSGGPHALACAAAANLFPQLKCCSLISSDAPYYKLGMNKQMYGQDQVTLEYALERAKINEANMIQSYKSMSKPERVDIALADITHSTKYGLLGAASDSVLEASIDWGYDLNDVKVNNISLQLWHGTEDHDVPISAGDYMSSTLGGKFTRIEGESHTLIRRHWQTILSDTVEVATASKSTESTTMGTKL